MTDKLHPVSAKIDDELFAWLKERVKSRGTSQAVEIEACMRMIKNLSEDRLAGDNGNNTNADIANNALRMMADAKSMSSYPPNTEIIDGIPYARLPKPGDIYKIKLPPGCIPSRTHEQDELAQISDPRAEWYAKHGLTPPEIKKPKPITTMAELANKYPAFGDDE